MRKLFVFFLVGIVLLIPTLGCGPVAGVAADLAGEVDVDLCGQRFILDRPAGHLGERGVVVKFCNEPVVDGFVAFFPEKGTPARFLFSEFVGLVTLTEGETFIFIGGQATPLPVLLSSGEILVVTDDPTPPPRGEVIWILRNPNWPLFAYKILPK